jgi:hypothetical protein
MSLRHWLVAIVLAFPNTLSSSAPAPDTGAAAPAIIARLQPFDKLFDDAKYLAGKFGKPQAAKDLEDKLLQMLGIENLAASGIDTTKPSGAYVFVAADWTESIEVVMLPVKDDKAVLAFAGKFEVKADKIEDNFYSLALPDLPLPMFVRFSGGYAYLTAFQKEALAPEKLLPPARLFAGSETAALAVTVRPEQIPESARKSVLDYVAEQVKEAADDEDSEITKTQIRLYQKWIEMFLQDAREATLLVNFDRPSGELAFDYGVSPKAGTRLATEIAALKAGQSLFTKLVGPQGAINMLVNTQLPDEVSKLLVKTFQDAGDDLFDAFDLGNIDDEKQKEELRKVFRAIAPSFESGIVDAAITVRGPGSKHYSGLFGIKVKDGKKIEEQLKKSIAALSEDKRKLVKFDAEQVGNIFVHSIKDESTDASFEKIFGENVMFFGFRDDAVVLAFGEGAAKAVGEALAALSPQPAPAIQIDVTGGKLKQFCDGFDESVYGYVHSILGTDERLRIYAANVEGGTALKATATVSLQAIVGMVITISEMFGG